METMYFKKLLSSVCENAPARSAWDRGVTQYVVEIITRLSENREHGGMSEEEFIAAGQREQIRAMLNGARDWLQYSEGGSSLAYDCDIARRLCTPSELRKTQNGAKNPNSRETWLQCQARALAQAADRIVAAAQQLAKQ